MSATSDLLFTYLRSIFYTSTKAELDPEELDEDYVLLGKGLVYLSHCVNEYHEFANSLVRGDLGVSPPPPENEIAAPLKSIQANLKHLTWQSQQVAKGDYKQRVDYMGEFADAFNTMVEQLADRQTKLENEIEVSRKHADAMAQSNLLLRNLTQYIPEQIFVISTENNEVLLANDMAMQEIDNDCEYIEKIIKLLSEKELLNDSHYFDITLTQDNEERFLSINTYRIEWDGENAVAMVVKDVSDEKKQLKELEDFAYHDPLTRTYNRFFGMLTLNEWLEGRKQFCLVFVDMDNLKYVNDRFGHNEGDIYITKVSKYLQSYSPDAVVSRLGGDEYMLLIPDSDIGEVTKRMEDIQTAIQNDEHQVEKDFYYSISVGVVYVDETNELSASDVLSIADERMYKQKRARKKDIQSIM